LSTINLTQSQLKDLKAFCSLNKIEDMNAFISHCFEKGYNVEKYGLLGKMGGEQEKWVEKEVIREKRVEIPVEVIKEVEKIVEVIKEVPVDRIVEKVVIKEVTKEIPVEKVVIKEVIKEVPVEKVVTKIEYISDDTQLNELLLKIQQLEQEKQTFSTKTEEVENVYQDKISKKNEELDELRHSLDELLAKPPVEKIIEVIVEKPIVDEKQKLLQQTLQNLRGQLNLKDEEIKKLKEDIEYLKGEIDKPATFLRTSNLKDNIY
jgi:hypothetical protein